jgi:hypothetical protein
MSSLNTYKEGEFMDQLTSVNDQQLNDFIAYNIESYGMDYTATNYISLREQYYSMKYPS